MIKLSDDIKKLLHGSREIAFRYELLNKDDGWIGNLTEVTGNIQFNSLAEIKRTGSFAIKRNVADDIDWTSESIKPYFKLKTPSGWIEWSLGVLLLSSPTKQEQSQGKVIRNIDAFDKCQILKEDCFTSRYVINTGTNYITAIISIINSAGIGKTDLQPSTAVVSAPVEFEIGTSKLTAVNALLASINYYSLTFNEFGYAISNPYTEPASRAVDYEYRTNDISIIKAGASQTLDLFNAPNVFVRTVSSPDRAPLTSIFTNDNPASPLSTVRRGRNIVDFKAVNDISDQAALDAYTRRQALSSSQIYGETEFVTALMPHHGFLDCLYIEHSNMKISDIFTEKAWNMELKAGGSMRHTVRKVVQL